MSYSKQDTRNFKTGEIKFSDFRSIFLEQDTGPVSFSDLYRSSSDSAYVPDALENINVPTDGTLKSSNYRRTVKELIIVQEEDDERVSTNQRIFLDLFNTYNKSRNIKKIIKINGIVGNKSTSGGAFIHNESSYKNLWLVVSESGKIYGKGGTGGTTDSISGTRGGDAIRVDYPITIVNYGEIFAGGGGGGIGGDGGIGGKGGDGSISQTIPNTCSRDVYYFASSRLPFTSSTGEQVGHSGYSAWSSFMNDYGVGGRGSGANGVSDGLRWNISIPESGTYKVKAAADDSAVMTVGGKSVSVGDFKSSGSETNVYLDSGTRSVIVTLTNSYQPPPGGDDFALNPMAISWTIEGSFTVSYDCPTTANVKTIGGTGGVGGVGGGGGEGRGYNYPLTDNNTLSGDLGTLGDDGLEGATNAGRGGDGGDGGNGGDGGDWGEDGKKGEDGKDGNKGINGTDARGILGVGGNLAPDLTEGNLGTSGALGSSSGYYIYSNSTFTFINNGTVKGKYYVA